MTKRMVYVLLALVLTSACSTSSSPTSPSAPAGPRNIAVESLPATHELVSGVKVTLRMASVELRPGGAGYVLYKTLEVDPYTPNRFTAKVVGMGGDELPVGIQETPGAFYPLGNLKPVAIVVSGMGSSVRFELTQ